jgi:hypothetical protein
MSHLTQIIHHIDKEFTVPVLCSIAVATGLSVVTFILILII